MISTFQDFGVRAYRVVNEKLINKTVAELEAMPKEFRVFISRIRHEGKIIDPEPGTVVSSRGRDCSDHTHRAPHGEGHGMSKKSTTRP